VRRFEIDAIRQSFVWSMKGSGGCEALVWRGADRILRRGGDTNPSTYRWTATSGTRTERPMWTTWSSPAAISSYAVVRPTPSIAAESALLRDRSATLDQLDAARPVILRRISKAYVPRLASAKQAVARGLS
jgi:hypothetical protein